MGGGWSTPPSGKGTPLGHRVVDYGPSAGAAGATPRAPDSSRRRHCWVSDAGGTATIPGLVLDWRRGPDGSWWGFTQYVVEGTESARAILEWLPAHRLRPR